MLTWIRILTAAASGVALMYISAPANLHWLHWVSFLPLFWALREGDDAGNAVLGYITGYLGVFSCFFWLGETVVRFSNIPLFASLVVPHIYAFAFGAPYLVFGMVHPMRRATGRAWVVLFPALWVVTEWLVPSLFPYFQGVSQYRTPTVFQLASVTGVYGVSYLVLLTNCMAAEFVYCRQDRRPLPWLGGALVLVAWLGNGWFGASRLERVEATLAEARVVKVAILQQDVTMEERLAGSAREAVESWFRLSARVRKLAPDLVVWPEGSSPYNPDEPPMVEALKKLVANGKYELLLGGGTREVWVDGVTGDPSAVFFNSAYLMGRDGEFKGRYDKMVPLPFGEYIPLSGIFPVLREIIKGPGDFRAGTTPTIFQADGYTFAVPICYEAILERTVRKMKDADLFINITNDAWFGDTASPHQHAMLAAVRSVEFGRPTLRLAYTGISMIVEPSGRIVYETRPFQEVTEVVPLRLGRVETVYARTGNWFAALCLLASSATVAWMARRRLSPRDPSCPAAARGPGAA